MPGALRLRTLGAERTVGARRSPDTPAAFWLQARSEWGSDGPQPNEELQIPVERFLHRLAWLAPACRVYGVSLQWEDGAEALVRRHRSERGLLSATLGAPATAIDVDAALDQTRWVDTPPLKGFQKRDLAVLLGLPHGANFSVPGAGKTAVTLALYAAEYARGRVARLLVIAPPSAFESWEQEIERRLLPTPTVHFYDGKAVPDDAEIVVLNYQRMLVSYEGVAAWALRGPTQVVLDEAHRVKRGRAGMWGSAALDIGFLAARRDILTGTPAPQSPRDLGALLDFLWWGRGHEVLPSEALVADPTETAVRSVAEAIRPLFVRTTKEDLKLPEMRPVIVPVPLEGLHRDVYKALRSEYAGQMGRLERATWSRMGRVVMYLLEAATNPGLLAAGSTSVDPPEFRHPPLPIPDGSTLGELVAAYGSYETPRKLIRLAELLEANRQQGRKTLVWSNFIRSLTQLERMLAGLKPAVVHGGIPLGRGTVVAGRTREDELERFRTRDDCWVLLANPAAMAEGISLHTVCQDAIYLERTFNAGQYLQSLDRIHRLGLEQDVRITFLVTKDTIDEVVAERVGTKAKRLFAMLDDPSELAMALPDEEQVGDPLDVSDAADIAALFAHLRGASAGG
jgi:SNF2 family DNA or RNA helicase